MDIFDWITLKNLKDNLDRKRKDEQEEFDKENEIDSDSISEPKNDWNANKLQELNFNIEVAWKKYHKLYNQVFDKQKKVIVDVKTFYNCKKQIIPLLENVVELLEQIAIINKSGSNTHAATIEYDKKRIKYVLSEIESWKKFHHPDLGDLRALFE